jgi:hypothetical protein
MVKLTFTLFLFLAFSSYSYSQIVEDYEHILLNVMTGENDASSMVVVSDPDPDAGEENNYVVQFTRDQQGVPWGGFWSTLPEPIDMTSKKYIHVDVWKPRVSGLRFKVEGGPAGDFELDPVEAQTLTEEWETITFHFPDADGEYPTIAFMPDFEDPVGLEEDIVIYFDNIVLSDNPEPGEGETEVIEDFNFIPMNLMLGGEDDDSEFRIVPNPLPEDEVNSSNHVVEFRRSQHGVPWGGFWSPLPEPLDLSENKYVYAKVLKPRISPIRFKVEQGPTDNLEIESMAPQTVVDQWEEVVFDFSEKDGQWNIIAFMPDFQDPVGLDEDIVIYFDDIRLGDEPATDIRVIRPGKGLETSVYPNPASGSFSVEAPVHSQIALINIAGQVVHRQTAVAQVTTIDLSNMLTGLYLVRVTDGSNVRTIKLVVR